MAGVGGDRPNKHQLFTASGTFNVPAGVSVVFVTGTGAGCGGMGAGGCGGGGSGSYCVRYPVPVTPGGTLSITIGAAGAPGAVGNTGRAQPGGDTIVGILTLRGAPGWLTGGSVLNGSQGGGDGGGVSGATPGVIGNQEGPWCWGGSSGGSFNDAGQPGNVGGPCQGWQGGLGGSSGASRAGCGGGASMFGPGGNGANSAAGDGGAAPATSYGAGGGGASGATATGGVGRDGAVLIEWTDYSS